VAGLEPQDLLARPDKQGGDSARGPVVRLDGSDTPLDQLKGGQKLHIVGGGNGETIAGRAPEELARLLTQLGLKSTVRLKQIHLIANRTGFGAGTSYASQFLAAIETEDIRVDEVKAPLGDVRCDAKGKIWVKMTDAVEWQPSSSALNYYAGPRIENKHRRPLDATA
ncbi:MAG: C80 family cysteine peptidase, partial [Bryobacteraceae bacterium]